MQIENKKGTCTFKLACFVFLSLSHPHRIKSSTAQTDLSARHFFFSMVCQTKVREREQIKFRLQALSRLECRSRRKINLFSCYFSPHRRSPFFFFLHNAVFLTLHSGSSHCLIILNSTERVFVCMLIGAYGRHHRLSTILKLSATKCSTCLLVCICAARSFRFHSIFHILANKFNFQCDFQWHLCEEKKTMNGGSRFR